MKASPSSIKRIRKCKRQWAFRYCAGLPQIDAPHFEFGKKLHKHAEEWLTNGTPAPDDTKEGRLFYEGIPHLPRPGDAECELHVAIWLNEDLSVAGVLVGEGPIPDAPYVFFGYVDVLSKSEPLLADHKTYGNAAYVLTAEDLENDEAAVIYSAAVAHGRDLDELLLRWVYYSKQRPKAFPIEAVISREDGLIKLKTYIPDLQEMARIRAEFRDGEDLIAIANTIPNDPRACDSQGRNCDYWQHCRIQEPSKEDLRMAEAANDRVAALKAKIAAKKEAAMKANAPEGTRQADDVAKEVSKPPVSEAPPAQSAPEKPADESPKAEEPAKEAPAEKGKPGRKPKATQEAPSGAQQAVQETLEGLLSNGKRLRIEISLVA